MQRPPIRVERPRRPRRPRRPLRFSTLFRDQHPRLAAVAAYQGMKVVHWWEDHDPEAELDGQEVPIDLEGIEPEVQDDQAEAGAWIRVGRRLIRADQTDQQADLSNGEQAIGGEELEQPGLAVLVIGGQQEIVLGLDSPVINGQQEAIFDLGDPFRFGDLDALLNEGPIGQDGEQDIESESDLLDLQEANMLMNQQPNEPLPVNERWSARDIALYLESALLTAITPAINFSVQKLGGEQQSSQTQIKRMCPKLCEICLP